jgi:hypothetical protein
MAQHSFDISKGSQLNNGPVTFEHRRSLLDDPFTGDRLPERLGNGPVERKRMTDTICMFICLGFLVLFIVLAIIYGFWNNYHLISKPMDSDARICGEDDPVKDHKYLLLFKFERNYRSVCVRRCPVFDYNQIKYNPTGTNISSIEPLFYENYTRVVKRPYAFGYGSSDSRNSNFDYDPDFASGYFTEQDFNNYRANYKLDCVPNTDITDCKHAPANGINFYDSRPYTLNICFPLSPKIMRHLQLFGDISAGFYADIAAAKWLIFLSMLLALALALLFLFLTSFFISWLIWVMIGVFVLMALFIGIMCWIVAFGDYSSMLSARNYSPYLVKKYDQLHEEKWQMILTGLILFILAAVVILFAVFNFKSIRQASSILKYTVTVIAKNFHLVVLAIFCFILQVFTIFLCLWMLVGIYTSGELVRDSVVGEPIPRFNLGFFRWVFGIFTVICTYWFVCFINNFADFVAAATTVNFYFARRNAFMGALGHACRYHLGSIALASLIMAPLSLLQLLFGWLFDLLTATGNEGEENAAQKIASKVCICIVYPYRRWVLRATEAAYGMVHLGSADFWVSSKETYYLFLAYTHKVGKLDLVLNLYKMVVVLTIGLLNALIFYGILNINYFVREISNPFIPVVAIFFISMLIALLFMNIYTTVTEAVVMCYLIETDTGRMPRIAELNLAMQQAEVGNGLNRYDPLK